MVVPKPEVINVDLPNSLKNALCFEFFPHPLHVVIYYLGFVVLNGSVINWNVRFVEQELNQEQLVPLQNYFYIMYMQLLIILVC